MKIRNTNAAFSVVLSPKTAVIQSYTVLFQEASVKCCMLTKTLPICLLFIFSGPWQRPEDVFGPMCAAEGVLSGLSNYRTWNPVEIPAESSH